MCRIKIKFSYLILSRQQTMKIISDFKPHCVFLQRGGNDLAGEADPAKLARDIVTDRKIQLAYLCHPGLNLTIPDADY
jgi:hypothetical protein